MSDELEVVFLGLNDAGRRVYEWLCDREGVFVHSLLTTEEQLQVIEDVRPDYVVSVATGTSCRSQSSTCRRAAV